MERKRKALELWPFALRALGGPLTLSRPELKPIQAARARPLELVDESWHFEHLLEKEISVAAAIFTWLQEVSES